MNAKETLALINEMESRFPVDQWQINAIHVWPIIRIQIFFEMRDILVGAGRRAVKGYPLLRSACLGWGVVASFARYFRAYLTDFVHNARPDKADVIFLGDQVSRIPLNGVWYDRLCDPVAECLRERRMTHFQLDPHHTYRVPRHGSSLFVQPSLDWVRLKSIMLRKRGGSSGESLEGFTDFVRYLDERNMPAGMVELGRLRRKVSLIRSMADYFRKILDEVKPCLGFVVEYYGQIGMAFNLACHECGIKTVEMPHGNHGEIHVAYSRWNRLPPGGYELLPSVFWCWTEVEANLIRQWSSGHAARHRPFVGGNLWLELWQRGVRDIVREYDVRIRTIKELHPEAKHILVTYEYNIEDMLELMKKAPLAWQWWVRLHPTRIEEKEKIRRLIRQSGIGNCELDNATDLPLYAILRHMDAHVTECSSVVIEAETFGVPSVITRDYGVEAFPEQIASGWSVAAYTCEDIIEAISSQMGNIKNLIPVGQKAVIDSEHPLDSLLASGIMKDRH